MRQHRRQQVQPPLQNGPTTKHRKSATGHVLTIPVFQKSLRFPARADIQPASVWCQHRTFHAEAGAATIGFEMPA